MRDLLRGIVVVLAGLLAGGCAIALAEPPPDTGAGFWRVLDTRAVGAASWLKKHPDLDGRGVVVAVLDTGVDMLQPGLITTPQGEPKVIEARDFSGQGEVVLAVASIKEIGGVRYLSTDEGKVRGFEGLPIKADEGEWFLGFLEEERFRNSAVTDLNQNGSTTDRFAVLTAPAEDGWVVYVDLDGNQDFTGAEPRKSYHETLEPFTFPVRDPEFQRAPLAFALHIDESGTIVTFHFDDGGHGTHVAGIATGYRLMGRTGFDGIAPGAQVLSLKIGDNTLSGGATTTDSMYRAIEFAGKWSKDHERPVIINISYGIGSEIEGRSAIDAALDSALVRYPMLHASVSAGNEGPGLSTVGTPAAARYATAVAAMLPKAASEALFGFRATVDRVFSFSSRGGELAKPDVLAPGIASSSVPVFDDSDIKGGTSMAAPEVTGIYALMASAALAQKMRFNGSTLKRALLHSARPIPGYPLVAQGAGVPDVGRAVEALRKLSQRQEPFKVVAYDVLTPVPTSVDREGNAAYWRTGTYLPPDDKGQDFRIEPVFREDADATSRASFHTMVRFESTADWLNIDRDVGRMIGDQGLNVNVTYDEKALRKPGVHSARVDAIPDDGAGIPAFSLWSTVVTPHTFTRDGSYELDLRDQRLKPGEIQRLPVLVPPGATSMTITVETPKGAFGSTGLYLYDPAGRPWPVERPHASSEYGTTAVAHVDGDDLDPGIWEAIAYGSWRNRKETRYDVAVRFRALAADPVRNVRVDPGERPRGRLAVTNRYDVPFDGTIGGQLLGFRRTVTREVPDDIYQQSLELNQEIERIDFVLRLDPKTYNRFTDVAVTVLDASGTAVVKEGFSIGVARFSLPNTGGTGSYTLKIVGGKARGGGDPWKIEIEETWVRRDRIGVSVGSAVLYPNIRVPLTFYLGSTPPRSPDGYVSYGEITFTDRRRGETWLTLPMYLR